MLSEAEEGEEEDSLNGRRREARRPTTAMARSTASRSGSPLANNGPSSLFHSKKTFQNVTACSATSRARQQVRSRAARAVRRGSFPALPARSSAAPCPTSCFRRKAAVFLRSLRSSWSSGVLVIRGRLSAQPLGHQLKPVPVHDAGSRVRAIDEDRPARAFRVAEDVPFRNPHAVGREPLADDEEEAAVRRETERRRVAILSRPRPARGTRSADRQELRLGETRPVR